MGRTYIKVDNGYIYRFVYRDVLFFLLKTKK